MSYPAIITNEGEGDQVTSMQQGIMEFASKEKENTRS